jgi:hypothetical protein
MKYPEIKITIPEPCHEDWTKMNTTEKGKFCSVCTKEVIDFTSNSDEEIVKHFTNHGNTCGRFHETQLNRKLIADRKKRNHWLSYAASLLLPITLFSQEVKKDSQNIPKTEQTHSKGFKSLNIGSLHKQGEVSRVIQKDSLTVSGVISDDTGLPLPAATIIIKGTDKKVMSDFDGNYSIKAKKNEVLVVSYVGFESKEFKVLKNEYSITLKEDENAQVNVVYAGWYETSMLGSVSTVKSGDLNKNKRKEKREKRRAKRAERKAERKAKHDVEKN